MHQLDSPICICYPHKNHASTWFIAQIIKLRANYLEHQIKSIRIDSAAKFSSKAFNYYCMALGINVEYFRTLCTYTKWISQISYQENNLITSGNWCIGDEQFLSQKGSNSSCKEFCDEFVTNFDSSKMKHRVRFALTKRPKCHEIVFSKTKETFVMEPFLLRWRVAETSQDARIHVYSSVLAAP